MAHRHLTNRYRPQTFGQVLGQQAQCRILSRAAELGKLAPAYMFSGTRGVGKTTVARILAKAINCAEGPAAEPCNECRYCRQIAQGAAVDVMEVDGASNTGVDNVRRLTEEIGYSPVECRYKVVIIDEAHMLSRSAFNALLKTLEEPPAHALFILATTEPHKFPATIVSRCQHFVFKLLPRGELEEHLRDIATRESLDFEPEALSLLARKGAGSVRDSLSLLSQIIALGEDIRLDTVRDVLAVADRDILEELMQAILQQDCAGLVSIARRLLEQGLDIGFFLQELTSAWRNMFILKQAGQRGREILDLPEEEIRAWTGWAERFSLSHLHASWQMCLEEQRRILTSMDPALALELLLLNLAYLPSLVSVRDLQPGEGTAEGGGAGQGAVSAPDAGAAEADTRSREEKAEPEETEGAIERQEDQPRDWEGFLQFMSRKESLGLPGFRLAKGEVRGDTVTVTCPDYLVRRMREPERYNKIVSLAREYFGREMNVELVSENGSSPRTKDLKAKVMSDPAVQEVLQEFQARVVEIKRR